MFASTTSATYETAMTFSRIILNKRDHMLRYIADRTEMKIQLGSSFPDIFYDPYTCFQLRAHGAFLPQINQIVLDLTDSCGPAESIVVHELTHWMQYTNGKNMNGFDDRIRYERELEAFTVQAGYIRDVMLLNPADYDLDTTGIAKTLREYYAEPVAFFPTHYTNHYVSGSREAKDEQAIADILDYFGGDKTKLQLLIDKCSACATAQDVQSANFLFGFAGIEGRPFFAMCRKYCPKAFVLWWRDPSFGDADEPCDELGYTGSERHN